MSRISLDHNLGTLDRILRGSIGLALLFQGFKSQGGWGRWLIFGSSLFLIPGLTGTDPLMKRLGVSTKMGVENNILNLMKQARPGHGIKPLLTEQATPIGLTRWVKTGETLAASLAIG